MTLMEDEAAPSGDSPPPMILGFIRYVSFLCVSSFIETSFILNFTENGEIIFPNVIVNRFIKQNIVGDKFVVPIDDKELQVDDNYIHKYVTVWGPNYGLNI